MASSCVWCGDKIGNIFFACTRTLMERLVTMIIRANAMLIIIHGGVLPIRRPWMGAFVQSGLHSSCAYYPASSSLNPLNSCLYCGGATTALFCSTNCKIITNNNFPNKLNSPIVPFPAPVNWFPLMSFDAKPLWVELNGCRFKRRVIHRGMLVLIVAMKSKPIERY
jgi:hypothetical protein